MGRAGTEAAVRRGPEEGVLRGWAQNLRDARRVPRDGE